MAQYLTTYTLYTQGPDNRSTYAECWGSTASSPGREVCTGTADEVENALHVLGHRNVVIRQHARRGMAARWLDDRAFRAVATKRGEL